MGFMFIKSYHPRSFVLSGRSSPNYERARFNWYIFREDESSGEAWIDFERMDLTYNGGSMSVSPKNLLKLFGYENAVKEDMEILMAFTDLLHAAKSGELPSPGHHSYQLDHPLNGYMSHGASGYDMSHMTLAWVAGWSLVGSISLWRSFKIRANAQAA